MISMQANCLHVLVVCPFEFRVKMSSDFQALQARLTFNYFESCTTQKIAKISADFGARAPSTVSVRTPAYLKGLHEKIGVKIESHGDNILEEYSRKMENIRHFSFRPIFSPTIGCYHYKYCFAYI